jgi:hypothetical protein
MLMMNPHLIPIVPPATATVTPAHKTQYEIVTVRFSGSEKAHRSFDESSRTERTPTSQPNNRWNLTSGYDSCEGKKCGSGPCRISVQKEDERGVLWQRPHVNFTCPTPNPVGFNLLLPKLGSHTSPFSVPLRHAPVPIAPPLLPSPLLTLSPTPAAAAAAS